MKLRKDNKIIHADGAKAQKYMSLGYVEVKAKVKTEDKKQGAKVAEKKDKPEDKKQGE